MVEWEVADTFQAVSPAALMARPDIRRSAVVLRTPIMAAARMVGPATADGVMAGAATDGTAVGILIGLGDGVTAGAVIRIGVGA
jgi:hypothetical protein